MTIPRIQRWQLACATTWLIVAGALAASPPSGAAAAEAERAPFLGGFLKETRIVYPLRVGDWEAQGEHLYDQPELGASVRYRHRSHEDRWIDLYFYPAGVLPPSRLDGDAQQTLDELRAAIGQPDYYSKGEFDVLRPFSITSGEAEEDETIQARSAGMRLARDGGAYHSALVLLVHDLYYVKGRYSVEEDALTRDGTREQLEAFVTDVMRDTEISSSGDCWMPLPIEGLRGPAPEDKVLASSNSESGEATEFLMHDRVLAVDPDSDGAQALMLLGMAMTGRIVPGCSGAEPSNPVVPEGSREIRLEYRAPDDARADPGRRLRGARSGIG